MHASSVPRYRRYTVPIVLIVLLQHLVGCSPVPQPPPAQLPTTVPTQAPAIPTQVPSPTATSAPSPTPFVPKATIKIVVHVPLSGGQADIGTDLERAVETAVQELSEPLNDLGYQVTLVPYDDKMDIKTAVANAKEIVADPEVLCGVGHYASNVMMQASEIYHSAGLAFVSPSNTATTVTDRGYLEVNRISGRLDSLGIAAAQFAKSKGFSSVYILQAPWDPGAKNADYFKREADRIGLKVVGVLTTEVSDDFTSIIAKVMHLNPDLVYVAALSSQAGPFFRQARAAGYTGAFLTMGNDPGLADLAGPLLADGAGAYYLDTSAPVDAYPGAAQFAKDFNARYGSAPRPFAAEAYDAAGVCLKSIEDASKAKSGELPTRGEVAKAIRALVDYPGITGTYTFNKRGDPTLANYFVYKVTNVDAVNWSQNEVVATLEVAPPK